MRNRDFKKRRPRYGTVRCQSSLFASCDVISREKGTNSSITSQNLSLTNPRYHQGWDWVYLSEAVTKGGKFENLRYNLQLLNFNLKKSCAMRAKGRKAPYFSDKLCLINFAWFWLMA